MYFSGNLSIDPSQATQIKRVKPNKMFAKILDAITFGAATDKQEQETFTAVSILQQINMGLRSANIKNVIRIAIDDYDFYLDAEGREDDLIDAMFMLESKIDPIEAEYFNTIYLVLEHLEGSFKYLVEISVQRKHKVGEYPINVEINGAVSDFKLNPGESRDELAERLQGVFKDQETYDEFSSSKRIEFTAFVDTLELALRKFIKVDDIRKQVNANIIRPKKKIDAPAGIRHERHAGPMYYGYYGLDDFLFYSFIWGGMMYNHNIYVHDVNIVDEVGADVMNVGEEGFRAGDFNTLNEEADFEPPMEGDIDFSSGSEYEADLEEKNLLGGDDYSSEDASLDSFDSSWSDDGGFDSSCSSCGGCSD